MRANFVIPSLAIALAASPALGQTVISRTVAPQAVETIVTETPTGTIVTRRPLDGPAVAQPTLAHPGSVAPAIAQPVLPAPALVETDTIDAITTREVVRRAEAAPRRQLTTREVAARPAARTERKAVRSTKVTTMRVARPAPRLVLTPRERQIVYRTIVAREMIPRQQVVVAPAALPAPYTPAVAVPARAPIVSTEEVMVDVAAPIAVGSILPESVPLYAIPQNVALGVPATRPYSYAYLGGRAYLVDPVSSTVMADVTD